MTASDDKDKVRLCPRCGKAPRHVTATGTVTTYCRQCRNRIASDRYRNNPQLKESIRVAARARYKDDAGFRANKRKTCLEYAKANRYYQSERFRLSAIKTNMVRLDDSGLDKLALMLDGERLSRQAKRISEVIQDGSS